uniref:Uncharacterized protein n=1 Tax=Salmonella sp. TaxID=599 RepID=A0A482ETJ5_SALSP|nr:hypothetical protein [Salmonella sp.]QBM91548.1 hypothetical protein NNIBIDOC_00222 [Salmonella sp.]
MLYEIDARLQTNESGVIIAEGSSAAWMARLDEWLRTPEGVFMVYPLWGIQWKNLSMNHSGSETSHIVEVAIEGRMMKNYDLPCLMQGIRCTSSLPEDSIN